MPDPTDSFAISGDPETSPERCDNDSNDTHVRRGRTGTPRSLARDPPRTLPRPHRRALPPAGRPRARLSGHPSDRHQWQDLDESDDRHAAARARPAYGTVHESPPAVD